MKTTFAATCAVALILAGCQGGTEPAAPPTSQDALTTTDAAPTTAMSDDVEATSEASGDADATTEAGGPPELPDQATEDSESGAEAFALHYLDVLNYSAMKPAVGYLDELASEECETCDGFEQMMDSYNDANQRAAGPIIRVEGARAAANGLTTTVFVDSVQTVPATLASDGAEATAAGEPTDFQMVMRLSWANEGWKVAGIQVQQ